MSLVNTKIMLKKAYEQNYAIGAFNVNNMEIIQAIVDAAAEEKSQYKCSSVAELTQQNRRGGILFWLFSEQSPQQAKMFKSVHWPKALGAERHLRATKICVLKQPQTLFRMQVGGWGDPWQKEHGGD